MNIQWKKYAIGIIYGLNDPPTHIARIYVGSWKVNNLCKEVTYAIVK